MQKSFIAKSTNMKKYLLLSVLFLLFFFPARAQVVQKPCIGIIDTIMGYDTTTKLEFIRRIDTTDFIVLGTKVLFAKFDSVDVVQKIVICEGLYDNLSTYITGTNGRYFNYLGRKFPFVRLTPSEINQIKY